MILRDQCLVCGEAQGAKDLYLSRKLSELLNAIEVLNN